MDYPPVHFQTGMLDTYINGVLVNEHVNVQGDHYKLIPEICVASTVLLKNVNCSALSLAVLGTPPTLANISERCRPEFGWAEWMCGSWL